MRPVVLFPFALLLSGSAIAAGAHVHGAGSLELGIDRDTVSLNLEMPLDAALGFERAPKTEKEKAALAEAVKALNDAAGLFVFPAAAQCKPKSVQVSAPFADAKSAKAAGEHADFDAAYVFQCAQPAQLNSVETTVFKRFGRLYRLEVQRAGPSGQGAARLTPKQPSLRW